MQDGSKVSPNAKKVRFSKVLTSLSISGGNPVPSNVMNGAGTLSP